MHNGSFTIEASIYVPIVLFLIMNVLSAGIYFFQESRMKEANVAIESLDIVQEFYNYQILGEVGKEVQND